ncbi:MAG: class I SAM-dependent methyltransferase [Pseudomonadota bacterium]
MLRYFLPFTSYPFTGAPTDCPVCSSRNHSRICRMDRKLKRLQTHLCNECGLFFHHPMPTADELAAYYAAIYRVEYQFMRREPSRTHQARKAGQTRHWIAHIRTQVDLDRPLRTLDVGCGSGELVHRLAELGHEAHGLEPGDSFAGHAADHAPANACIHCCTWDAADLAPASFDLITSLQVLEHLDRPVDALRQIRDWLTPDGVLVIEVPDMAAYTCKGFDRFHFAHVLGFSRDNLLLALERAGLAPMRHSPTTSFFAVHAESTRARCLDRDLKATAERNRREYSAQFDALGYLNRHVRRIWRVAGHQRGRMD